MKAPRMKAPTLALLAAAGALAACGDGDGQTTVRTTSTKNGAVTSGVEVRDAWCRPTPNGRDATACYAILTAAVDDRLVSVSTPAAGLSQIHDMVLDNEMMRMSEMPDGLPLPAGEAVALAPNSKHLMLTRMLAPAKVGEMVVLTLTFETTAPITVNAPVRQPTA